jgi:putative pyruvate formate lyase activating enzyme
MTPAYLASVKSGRLDAVQQQLEDILSHCTLCPRQCGVDRTSGDLGYCGADAVMKVASWGPHHGEEPPLVGTHGSGTIFLAHCPVQCEYCQNYDISISGHGAHSTCDDVASMMLHLQGMGCHNINLVTPTHYAPQLIGALGLAARRGLTIPVVWNCGGYESRDVIEMLAGMVDIYMPDVKYADNDLARRYSNAQDYVERSNESLREMHRQVGDLVIKDGLAVSGLLIRHLVLPGHADDSKRVVDAVAELSPHSYLNVMGQYRPCYHAHTYPGLDRRVSRKEVEDVRSYAREKGLRGPADHML